MSRQKSRISQIFASVIFLAGFGLLLLYFYIFDIYDTEFFEPHVTLFYNLSRTLFCVYLFGMICAPGFIVLSAIGGWQALADLGPLPRLTVSFFCGAAVWHGVLLILGFLNLYRYPVFVGLSLPAVALAFVYLRESIGETYRCAGLALRSGSTAAVWITRLLAGLILITAFLLLVVKGLFPNGGHDYYNHYHSYYEEVIRNHGIQPNNVWYHFYYSKGMGLFFLASVLTDPLAPALVTYCFAVATAMALFLLIDRTMPKATFWPLTAVVAYFAFYIYTPGLNDYRSHGGWGDFEKPHEIGAAFILCVVWLSAGLPGAAGNARRIWLAAGAICIFIVAFIELVSALLLGFTGLVLTVTALLRRRWEDARSYLALCVAGGMGVVSVIAVNFAETGLASDQFIFGLKSWVLVQPLEQWGALPYVLLSIQDRAAMQATEIELLSWKFLEFCRVLFRFDLLKPLIINFPVFFSFLGGAVALRISRRSDEAVSSTLMVFTAVLVAVIVAAATAGVAQTISFYRYCTFCLPLVIGLICCCWIYISTAVRGKWLNRGLCYVLPLLVLIGALSQFWINQKRFLVQVLPHAFAFASGVTSIRQAYAEEQGWPGRHPWGGIFPGTVGAWQNAGPGTRIWSMHLGAYCMLPHCRAETFISFLLSPHLLDMLAGTPEEIRDVLQKEDLNYFFYTTEMDIFDILPLMRPFAPEEIDKYIGIKWTDGTSFLLTWLGPGVSPLSREWVARYKKAVDAAPAAPAGFPIAMMLSLRDQLKDKRRWLSDLKILGIATR